MSFTWQVPYRHPNYTTAFKENRCYSDLPGTMNSRLNRNLKYESCSYYFWTHKVGKNSRTLCSLVCSLCCCHLSGSKLLCWNAECTDLRGYRCLLGEAQLKTQRQESKKKCNQNLFTKLPHSAPGATYVAPVGFCSSNSEWHESAHDGNSKHIQLSKPSDQLKLGYGWWRWQWQHHIHLF